MVYLVNVIDIIVVISVLLLVFAVIFLRFILPKVKACVVSKKGLKNDSQSKSN